MDNIFNAIDNIIKKYKSKYAVAYAKKNALHDIIDLVDDIEFYEECAINLIYDGDLKGARDVATLISDLERKCITREKDYFALLNNTESYKYYDDVDNNHSQEYCECAADDDIQDFSTSERDKYGIYSSEGKCNFKLTKDIALLMSLDFGDNVFHEGIDISSDKILNDIKKKYCN